MRVRSDMSANEPLSMRPTKRLVRSPLDRRNVDTVLMHFPKRRQIAQFLNLALEQVDYVIDVLLGREAADRKTDRAVREFVVSAKRTQHIRRFQRGRRTCRTRR